MNDIRTEALLLSTLKALEHGDSLATEHTGRESKPVNQRALLQSMTHAHVLAVDISLNTGSVLLQSMLYHAIIISS
jgi:hypothetical protein